jgi:hypothetical protein
MSGLLAGCLGLTPATAAEAPAVAQVPTVAADYLIGPGDIEKALAEYVKSPRVNVIVTLPETRF